MTTNSDDRGWLDDSRMTPPQNPGPGQSLEHRANPATGVPQWRLVNLGAPPVGGPDDSPDAMRANDAEQAALLAAGWHTGQPDVQPGTQLDTTTDRRGHFWWRTAQAPRGADGESLRLARGEQASDDDNDGGPMPVFDATADLGDGAPLDAQGDGEVMSDADAVQYLLQQSQQSPLSNVWQSMYDQQAQQQNAQQWGGQQPQQWGGQQPQQGAPQQYGDQQPWGPSGPQQPQTYGPPDPSQPWPAPPSAPPVYPPQPSAPFGLDGNGVPLPAPYAPSPAAPYGVDASGAPLAPYGLDGYGNPLPAPPSGGSGLIPAPRAPSMADLMRAMRSMGPLHIQTGDAAYDGQWRVAMVFLAPDLAEIASRGFVLETSGSVTTAGTVGLPIWRLVTEATAASDSPEYTGGATSRIGAAAPVVIVRPKVPTHPYARSTVPDQPHAIPMRPPGPLKVPPMVPRAPVTRVTLVPGQALATVKLPTGARATRVQVRPVPVAPHAQTPSNPYDGRWHMTSLETPPAHPQSGWRLVHRSNPSAGGALSSQWRFLPLLTAHLSPGASSRVSSRVVAPRVVHKIGGALSVTDDGRILRIEHEHAGHDEHIGGHRAIIGHSSIIGAPPDPNAPRYDVRGNASRSSIANDSSSAANAGPAFLVPGHFLTEIQRDRFPTIIGGCACVPQSALEPSQAARIGDFWSDFQRGFSTVDHALDQGWQVARPFVPYGGIIDQFHQARMNAMYGPQGGAASQGTAPGDQAIMSAQDITRRSRKGDPTAQQQMVQIKEAAARGDANAIRTWRVIVLVTRDDDARIASGDVSTPAPAPTSSAPSSSSPSSSAPPSGLGGLLQGFGGAFAGAH